MDNGEAAGEGEAIDSTTQEEEAGNEEAADEPAADADEPAADTDEPAADADEPADADADADEAEAAEKPLEQADDIDELAMQNKAAAKIQAIQRGRSVRKKK